MSLRFDKLRFVKKIQNANWDDKAELAETLADAFDEALEQSQNELLTKAEFQTQIAQLELRLNNHFNATVYKMAGLIIAGVGLLMGLMKFIG